MASQTRPLSSAPCALLGLVCWGAVVGQVPSAGLDSHIVAESDSAIIGEVVRHLEAMDEAAVYACEYQTTRLSLAKGTLADLKGSQMEFLVPLLAEGASDAESPAAPLTKGRAAYSRGRYVNYASNRICGGAQQTTLVYYDGVESLEFFEDQVATMRRGASESGVIGLPWTLGRFGAKRLAPILRAAVGGRVATLGTVNGRRGVLSFSLNPEASVEHASMQPGWLAEITFDHPASESQPIIHAIRISKDGRQYSEVVFLGFDQSSPLLPTNCKFTVLLPHSQSTVDIHVAHSIHIQYGVPCIDPQHVLAQAAKAVELRGNNDILLPTGGIDDSLAAAAKVIEQSDGKLSTRFAPMPSSGALREPPSCSCDDLEWPLVAAWLQESMRNGLIQTREAASSSMCLQVACVLVAKTCGMNLPFDDVAKRWPGARITVEQGLDILEAHGLHYRAIEIDKRDLLRCRDAFIVIDPSQEVGHATAAKVRGGVLFQLRGARRLVSQATDTVKAQRTWALVSKEDFDVLRR